MPYEAEILDTLAKIKECSRRSFRYSKSSTAKSAGNLYFPVKRVIKGVRRRYLINTTTGVCHKRLPSPEGVGEVVTGEKFLEGVLKFVQNSFAKDINTEISNRIANIRRSIDEVGNGATLASILEGYPEGEESEEVFTLNCKNFRGEFSLKDGVMSSKEPDRLFIDGESLIKDIEEISSNYTKSIDERAKKARETKKEERIKKDESPDSSVEVQSHSASAFRSSPLSQTEWGVRASSI